MAVMPLDEALQRHWPNDAHITCYSLVGATAWPRLNKSSLPGLRAAGSDVVVEVMAFDFDNPEHAAWCTLVPSAPTTFLARVGALTGPLSSWAALYPTRAGVRVVFVLEESLSPEAAEAVCQSMMAEFKLQGLDVDERCKTWNWLFRLPYVKREGRRTWAKGALPFGLETRNRVLSAERVAQLMAAHAPSPQQPATAHASAPKVSTAPSTSAEAAALSHTVGWLEEHVAKPGTRNEISMRVGGVMLRAGVGEEVRKATLAENLEPARHGGTGAREAQRIVVNAARRLRDGHPVSGWSRLTDLVGPEAVQELRRALEADGVAVGQPGGPRRLTLEQVERAQKLGDQFPRLAARGLAACGNMGGVRVWGEATGNLENRSTRWSCGLTTCPWCGVRRARAVGELIQVRWKSAYALSYSVNSIDEVQTIADIVMRSGRGRGGYAIVPDPDTCEVIVVMRDGATRETVRAELPQTKWLGSSREEAMGRVIAALAARGLAVGRVLARAEPDLQTLNRVLRDLGRRRSSDSMRLPTDQAVDAHLQEDAARREASAMAVHTEGWRPVLQPMSAKLRDTQSRRRVVAAQRSRRTRSPP